MSGLVFIDDENNSVLDEWMNDTSSFIKGSSELDLGEPVAGTSKGGLGFVETKASAKDTAAANKQKIANKAANKKRQLTGGDDDDEMHGQVEHIEESRTSFKGKVEKQVEATNKRKEEVQNKKAKTNANANATGGAAKSPAPVAPATSKGSADAKPNNKPAVAIPGFSAEATGETKEDRENSRKRKRTKTRSKQKNIRRDNRAVENKPSHLQVGSKEYQGRQLTKETKTVLGLAKK